MTDVVFRRSAKRSITLTVQPGGFDVVLALLGSGDGVDGHEVLRRLADAGRRAGPARVLAQLLTLEESGHVAVERGEHYRFRLTPVGEAAAYDLGPGAPHHAVLVMADIVGFVAFTARHGDVAAHALVQRLLDAAEVEVDRAGGRVVKSLGDGFLAVLPPEADVVPTVRRVARRFSSRNPDDTQSVSLRFGVHRGCPIRHGGDVFGADVNLVARLCQAAAPDELVASAVSAAGAADREVLMVRGLDTGVPVVRADVR